MKDKDLLGLLSVVQLLDPDTIDADATSSAIDLQGFNSVRFVVNVGASGATLNGTNKIELEIQEGDATNAMTAAPASSVRNAVTGTNTGCFAIIDAATEDDTVYTAQYTGNKRYAQVAVNFSGTHAAGTVIGVSAIAAGKQVLS